MATWQQGHEHDATSRETVSVVGQHQTQGKPAHLPSALKLYQAAAAAGAVSVPVIRNEASSGASGGGALPAQSMCGSARMGEEGAGLF